LRHVLSRHGAHYPPLFPAGALPGPHSCYPPTILGQLSGQELADGGPAYPTYAVGMIVGTAEKPPGNPQKA
jgi:hypothetical protein